MNNPDQWNIRNAANLCLILSCVLLLYVFYDPFNDGVGDHFHPEVYEFGRWGMVALVVLTFMGHLRLMGRWRQVFENMVYLFAVLNVIGFLTYLIFF